jgi:hypothetical protein
LPAELPVHERVEDPDPPETLAGEREQVRLVEFVVTENVTVPLKPFRGATVIVDVPATLVVELTLVGDAETE